MGDYYMGGYYIGRLSQARRLSYPTAHDDSLRLDDTHRVALLPTLHSNISYAMNF